MKSLIAFFLSLSLFAATPPEDKAKRHWQKLPDDSTHSEVCVDSNGLILAFVLMEFSTIEPGVWYVNDKDEHNWGRYTSRILAKRRAETEIGGCPEMTPIPPSVPTAKSVPKKKTQQSCVTLESVCSMGAECYLCQESVPFVWNIKKPTVKNCKIKEISNWGAGQGKMVIDINDQDPNGNCIISNIYFRETDPYWVFYETDQRYENGVLKSFDFGGNRVAIPDEPPKINQTTPLIQ